MNSNSANHANFDYHGPELFIEDKRG